MATTKVPNFERFLIDNGLLFEINRKVLHPLGLALFVEISYDNYRSLVIGGLLETDDPEGFIFDDETFRVGADKFRRFKLSSRFDKKIIKRLEDFGFVEQEQEQEQKKEQNNEQENE